MKINNLSGIKTPPVSKKAPVKKSSVQVEEGQKYVGVTGVFNPPDDPSKSVPMFHVCPAADLEKRYLSLSIGRVKLLLSHPSILERMIEWHDEQVAAAKPVKSGKARK
jgi:hypothetical protein